MAPYNYQFHRDSYFHRCPYEKNTFNVMDGWVWCMSPLNFLWKREAQGNSHLCPPSLNPTLCIACATWPFPRDRDPRWDRCDHLRDPINTHAPSAMLDDEENGCFKRSFMKFIRFLLLFLSNSEYLVISESHKQKKLPSLQDLTS